MISLETKKNNALGVEVDVETHKRITELPELLGIKNATIYKNLEFLNIKISNNNYNILLIIN